jgi:PHD/YefM family antitoxin component YafN of YafNO toxin-antitoxin module
MSSKSDVEKILNNAKEANVISSKDYSLETIDKLDENKLRESIKEILKKIK